MGKRRQARALRQRSKRASAARTRLACFEQLESRQLLTGMPYGAMANDTGEYMLGDVVATVVFFESDGSIDPSTEDWNSLLRDNQGNVVLDGDGRTTSTSGPNLIEETKQKIIEGLEWWELSLANFYDLNYEDTQPVHSLNYTFDFQYAHNPIATGYEPINRISNEYTLWAADFLDEVGYLQSTSMHENIRAFNDAQRQAYDTDWAYTIFVANDQNDFDGMFKLGGSFKRAFAYSGGRHLVSPAGRPASTFAHETGHIFYARDEYSGSGASYTDERGYYRTQNWNAYNNPDLGGVQQPSIMDTDDDLEIAWDTFTSSDSSLAMIGWQDTDGDGVFDVLDVPLTLSGVGYYNAQLDIYRFTGHSEAVALLNVNPSGLQNDITINEVNRLMYSVDDGPWTLAKSYDSPDVNIDVELPFEPGQSFKLRTESVDPITMKVVATSPELIGTVDLATSDHAGIQGFVWDDRDEDGQWDDNERGVEGWTLQLVDGQGSPLELGGSLDPDSFSTGQILSETLPGVTLSAVGWGVFDPDVAVAAAPPSAESQRVFGYVGGINGNLNTAWTSDTFMLRMDFDSPTSMVSIDAIAPADGSYGRLEVYKEVIGGPDLLLGRITTEAMQAGELSNLTLGINTADIDYAIARSTGDASIVLDNLQVGPEVTVTSGEFGHYAFEHLLPGDYHVQAVGTGDWEAAGVGVVDVTVDADGNMAWSGPLNRPSDFAAIKSEEASLWNNLAFAVDVNDDWVVSAVDALLVINDLNANGSRILSESNDPLNATFIDVSGDGIVSPRDALAIIAALNTSQSPALPTVTTVTGWRSAIVFGEGGAGGDSDGEGEASAEVETNAPSGMASKQSPTGEAAAESGPVGQAEAEPGSGFDALVTLLAKDRMRTELAAGAISVDGKVLADLLIS